MSERRASERGPFGEWIRERRVALGLSVREFAERGEIPENYITALELGRIQSTRKYLSELARLMGVTEAEVAARASGAELPSEDAATEEDDPVVSALLWELRELDDAGRKMVLDQVRAARKWQRAMIDGQD